MNAPAPASAPKPAPAPKPACAWRDGLRAAMLFAVDPAGLGGIVLRARAGPVRDRWLERLDVLLGEAVRQRRVPGHVSEDRLLGGLDLTATLASGRAVAAQGLLAEADGGVLRIPMAERMTATTAGHIAAAMDTGWMRMERDGLTVHSDTRFGVVALDEGVEDDERPPEVLADRLAIHIDLSGVSAKTMRAHEGGSARAMVLARERYADVTVSDEVTEAVCGGALALGIASLRAPLLAFKVARANAALSGRDAVTQEDLTLACRLVLAPRATILPPADAPEENQDTPDDQSEPEAADASEEEQGEPEDSGDEETDALSDEALAEVVLAAVCSALSPGQLLQLRAGNAGASRSSGRAGEQSKGVRGGRRLGVRRGRPRSGARLDLVETLRAAAPWQGLRGRVPGGSGGDPGPLKVRTDDLRVVRRKQRSASITIFVVDASGSAALHRLGETKGAVELLLGDCYLRRDRVALVAFRGKGAQVLLPPTRSLTQAKRSLAELPGGGGTPLAAGLDAAADLAEAARRNGETPFLVLLTDGRGNVARDGRGDREQARTDAHQAARRLRAGGVSAMLIDSSPRPRDTAEDLAAEMGARYLPLPQADAAALSGAVRAAQANRMSEAAA